MRVLISHNATVLLLELMPMLLVVQGFLILPRPLTTFLRAHTGSNVVGPLAVSKKEKLRLREEEERIKALEEAQQRIAQQELARNIRSGVAPIRKLLRNALRDGLQDLGDEVRLLVLEKYNAGEKYEDMLDVLHEETSNAKLNMYGLIAHAKLGKWDSAAQYADTFYDNNHNQLRLDLEGVFSKEQQEQIRMLLIQVFANANHNFDQALELYDSTTDPPLLLNLLLKCMLMKRDAPKEARQLFLRAENTNQDSFRLALSAAAKLGDVTLMQQVLVQLKSPSGSDNLLALETLCCSQNTMWSSQNQTFAMETIRNLTKTETKNIKNINLQPELFSKLITHLENSSDVKDIFFLSKRLHGGRKNWLDSLSSEARVRVLLTLEAESVARKKLVALHPSYSFGNDMDAVDILKSLITINKQGDVALKSSLPKFVQPSAFWSASLRLTAPECDRSDMEPLVRSIYEKYGAIMNTHPLTFVAKLYPIYRLRSPTSTLQIMLGLLEQVLSLVSIGGLSTGSRETKTATDDTKEQYAEIENLVSSFKDMMQTLASQPALGDYKVVFREAYIVFFNLEYAWLPQDKLDGKAIIEGINSVFDLILESNLFLDTELVSLALHHYLALSFSSRDPTPVSFPVQELEDKSNAKPPVLRCLIERAIECDQKSGNSDRYSIIIEDYRKCLANQSLLIFSITAGSLRDALRLGKKAAGTDKWYRDIWNTDTARIVLQADGIAEEVIKQVGENPFILWGFIQGMDELREVFDKLDLGGDYTEVCRKNIRVIVDFMFERIEDKAIGFFDRVDVKKDPFLKHAKKHLHGKGKDQHMDASIWSTTAWFVLSQPGAAETLSDDTMYDIMTALFDHPKAQKLDRRVQFSTFFYTFSEKVSPVVRRYLNVCKERYDAAFAENPRRPEMSKVFIRKSA